MPNTYTDSQNKAIGGVGTAFAAGAPGGLSASQLAALQGVQSAFASPTPLTPTPTPSPAPASPTNTGNTPASIYGDLGAYSPTAINSAQQASADFAQNGLSQSDQDTIRQQTLASFQAEIDAQNALYADKLKQAQVQGAGRIGSGTAIEARRGLLGSDFGNAQTDTINSANNDIYSSINDEKAAAISAIMDKANTQATQDIKDKTTAKQQGLDAYLKYLQDSSTRQSANADTAAKVLLAHGQALTDLPSDQQAQFLASYGISADALASSYDAAKKAQDEQAAKDAQAAQQSTDTHNASVSTQASQAAATQLAQQKYDEDVKEFGQTYALQQYQAATARISADAAATTASNKPPTVTQTTYANYAPRLETADQIITSVYPNLAKSTDPISYAIQKKLPSALQTSDNQQYQQAQLNFINAVLRQESGAAISGTEYDKYAAQYFPQPGDSQATIAQKAQNRAQVVASYKTAAGSAYVPPVASADSSSNDAPPKGTDGAAYGFPGYVSDGVTGWVPAQ